jgi:hypothetical protein
VLDGVLTQEKESRWVTMKIQTAAIYENKTKLSKNF